jgi:hypothetical protein
MEKNRVSEALCSSRIINVGEIRTPSVPKRIIFSDKIIVDFRIKECHTSGVILGIK